MVKSETIGCDVAILGGGPTGSTAAALLLKYNPDLKVLIIEKEKFPRDHVGESQLPSIGPILDEMGVWEKVEAAEFPIKIGASYTWGRNNDCWDFDFYPVEEWRDEPRPAQFEGQRRHTAFQVDRALYDDILLRHAESLGCEVREETRVVEVLVEGDQVAGLKLEGGEVVTARHYIDGSGTVGLIRRALDVESEVEQELRNIAVWDYWQNADWAVEIGVGATRVQVRSLPYGWIWFIPLGPTRTSIGVICPVDHYKSLGLTPKELYDKALREQPEIAGLLENAQCENQLQSCKDWSQLADRIVGENWFIAGEAAGFADPILAAGMSLAHSSAREAAYTILELDRGEIEADWLRTRYNDRNRRNIEQHIRFAKFWYSANGCFTDLQEHCRRIAQDAGIKLSPSQAWRWLSQGGFTTEQVGLPTLGSFDVSTTRQLLNLFDPKGRGGSEYLSSGYNIFKLNLKGATKGKIGVLEEGRIKLIDCYERGERRLPLAGYYGLMVEALQQSSEIAEIIPALRKYLRQKHPDITGPSLDLQLSFCVQALDIMIHEHWVQRSLNKRKPMLRVSNEDSRYIRPTSKTREVLEHQGAKCDIKWNLA
ncbi:MAG: NAD(P)/FAD-dependent oxidoreductase [Phycisphaerales bacterium]|nr:MAG: NAD(P)/FAD-dependent oxidoreductase [Phycisphaerales bacterium]